MAKASLSTPPKKNAQIQRCPKTALGLEYESNSRGGRGVWFARIPADHTVEDALSPYYFGLVQLQYGGLKSGDIIEIEPENGLWITRARVSAVVPALQQVKVRELTGFRHDFEVPAPEGYAFEWRGAEVRWAIVRLSDGVTIDGGFDTQDEAAARLEIVSADNKAA